MPIATATPADGGPPDDSPERACQRCANKAGLGYLDCDRILSPDPRALAAVPLAMQNDGNVLPCRLEGETLYVAMPENSARVRDRLASFTGLKIVPILAVAESLPKARRRMHAKADVRTGKIDRTVRLLSPEEAERDLDEHYAAMTGDERVSAIADLQERWGGRRGLRLERVAVLLPSE